MMALLTDYLPLLAGAPNGIKKLRELILELAVRGKLVPQDPSDEPASELLKRITADKEKLSPKVKKPSEAPDYRGAFELPESWCWASFGSIAQHNSGKTLDKGRNSGVPRDYITTSNLYWGRFDLSNVRQMLIEERDLARCTAFKNDLLICEGGEAGRAAVWDQAREICFQNHVHRARFFGEINPYYAQRYFERLNYSGEIADYRKGVGISNMSSKALASIPVPLPPLAEQHRIVAKVDELMALCDRLEAQQGDAESAHAQLVQALLDRLSQAKDTDEFAANWQRLVEHFHILFTTEPSIDALKQTLLQLAVMGKLVPQDPNDEPASELLRRIAEERESCVAGRRSAKHTAPPSTNDTEKTFEPPSGWEWVRLQQIISVSSGDGLVSANMKVEGGIPVYGGNGVTGYHDKKNIDKPTLVIGRVGYYCGSIHLTPASAWITDNALIVSFSEENLYKSFLFWLLKGTNLKEQENATAQPVISGRKIYPIVVAIPPLAEQHRIVAKVDQLMALCDQLKNRLTQARQLNEQLAITLVEQAVA